MANTWFRFKQFVIEQDQCAMKVGTDGVLLGAWADLKGVKKALDVGTGTGLIALMLAQRHPDCQIDAVEIEAKAAQQANENVASSPFAKNITIHHCSYQTFSAKHPDLYELIVSNPPFFNNSFQPNDKTRTLARHTDSLSYQELIQSSFKLLSPKGQLSVIVPYSEMVDFIKEAENIGLYPKRILKVFPTSSKPCKRVLVSLWKEKTIHVQQEDLVIEPNKRHEYSKEYIALLKDFYLHF